MVECNFKEPTEDGNKCALTVHGLTTRTYSKANYGKPCAGENCIFQQQLKLLEQIKVRIKAISIRI